MIEQNGTLVYERTDCPLVNKRDWLPEDCNAKRYLVKIWDGHSATCSGFLAWATSDWPEWAVIQTVAYIIDHDEYSHLLATEQAITLKEQLETQNSHLEDDELDEKMEDKFIHVAAMIDGADVNEYIRSKNLAILEADENHYSWYE